MGGFSWSSLSESDWLERLAVIAPQLESSEPLVAALSYGELARAPYGAMRSLKPILDPSAIAGWVGDPALAGRRAAWLASWPGRWALCAGGAVDLGENPAQTLVRELREEWSVEPEEVRVEALIGLPHRMTMLVGQAWLAPGAQVTRDEEHDEHAWWPANVDEWPEEADEPLRRMATLLGEHER